MQTHLQEAHTEALELGNLFGYTFLSIDDIIALEKEAKQANFEAILFEEIFLQVIEH